MKIEIIQKGDKYCCRFKRGFFTGWFWKYVTCEGYWFTPEWTSLVAAKLHFNDIKNEFEFKKNKVSVVKQVTL